MAASSLNVFISHTADDKPLADALRNALKVLFPGLIEVHYSTNKEEGGIPPGVSWFQWIVDRVVVCDVAYVLLTPSSIQRAWIPWEAGAVYGARLARAEAQAGTAPDASQLAPVQALLFKVVDNELPDPFSTLQFTSGESLADMMMVFDALAGRLLNDLTLRPAYNHAQKVMEDTVNAYLTEVAKTLASTPLTPTESAIQEWCGRLDDLGAQKRHSEARQLHRWLEVAFGREGELGFGPDSDDARLRPLDLRIHRRLGDLYLADNQHAAAGEAVQAMPHAGSA